METGEEQKLRIACPLHKTSRNLLISSPVIFIEVEVISLTKPLDIKRELWYVRVQCQSRLASRKGGEIKNGKAQTER